MRLGKVLNWARKYDESAHALGEALDLLGEEPHALRLLGHIRLEQGRVREAYALLRRSLAREPDHVATLVETARCALALGWLDKAGATLDKAAGLAPSFGLVIELKARLAEARMAEASHP